MSGDIDLKELRKRATSSFHEDGIYDITIGLLVLIWGFSSFTDDSTFIVIWVAVFPVYWWMKRRYTLPRIGMVRFARKGENSLPRVLVTSVIAGAIAVSLVFWWEATQVSKSFFYYFITDNWGVVLGVCAAAAGVAYARVSYIPRFYAYSAVTLVIIGTAQYTGIPFGAHLLALGGIFLGSGSYLLYTFIHKYPVQVVDGQNA
jgi:hypothetical protein